MGYTTVVPGQAITASWANANVRDQGVSQFASSAARTAGIVTPTEGLMSYQKDTDTVEYHDGVSWRRLGRNVSAYRTTDSVSTANDATVNDDTQLVITGLPAAGTFAIDGYLVYTCTSATPDFRAAWSVPAGATIPWWSIVGQDNGAASLVATTDWGALSGATTEHGRGTENGDVTAVVRGTLIMGGTAGSLTFRWAQVTSNAAGITLRAGSWILLHQLA